MNPILPLDEYIPDVEARVFSDGAVYLYGSRDVAGDLTYCSKSYNVYKSKDGMKTFEKAENVFYVEGEHFLYAPDCIEKDGAYYLFYCLSDGSEGVAVSSCPMGPFADQGLIQGVEKDGIDPAIFIDDDGTAYYFWGQFSLRGAKMQNDMRSIDKSTENRELLTEELHGFHEGASVRKRGNTYYLLYTDIANGRATCISYATSKSPLGPYKKRGVIIDNTGCDPQSWNNHGSMAQIDDQWYVFYHRSSHNSVFSRRVCCEKICFDESGAIAQVGMTSIGADESLPSNTTLSVSYAARLNGNCYLQDNRLTAVKDGDSILFTNCDMSNVTAIEVFVASAAHTCTIAVRENNETGALLCEINLSPTGGWNNFVIRAATIKPQNGQKNLCFVFCGSEGRLLEMKSFVLKNFG